MTRSKRPGRAQIAQNLANAIAGLSDGTYENANQAVNATGAPRAKLFRHLHGGKTRREANIQNQALTPAEESALVTFVKRATALGHPIVHTYLRELAEVLRKNRVAEEGVFPLGKGWVMRFLRHNPSLKSQLAKSMERARVEVTNRDGLRARTTREHSVSRSGFRVIGPISCKKYLNPTEIGPTPGRERTGESSRPSGSGSLSPIPGRDRAGIGRSECNEMYPN